MVSHVPSSRQTIITREPASSCQKWGDDHVVLLPQYPSRISLRRSLRPDDRRPHGSSRHPSQGLQLGHYPLGFIAVARIRVPHREHPNAGQRVFIYPMVCIAVGMDPPPSGGAGQSGAHAHRCPRYLPMRTCTWWWAGWSTTSPRTPESWESRPGGSGYTLSCWKLC